MWGRRNELVSCFNRVSTRLSRFVLMTYSTADIQTGACLALISPVPETRISTGCRKAIIQAMRDSDAYEVPLTMDT